MPMEIEGLAELSDRLENMPRRAAKRYINKIVDPGIELLEQALKDTAPAQIGILEESIVHKKSFEDSGGSTILTVDIGPTRQAFWGIFQEFGTQEVEGQSKKSGRHFRHSAQEGQHWMTRAWESNKEKVLSAIATEATATLMDLENKD